MMRISASAFRKRVRRLAGGLWRKKIAAIFLEPGSNFRYLTGLALGRSERLIAAILTPQAGLHIVGPAFERDRLRTAHAPVEIHTWREDEDPMLLVRDIVLGTGKDTIVAVGPTTRFFIVERMRVELPGYNFVDASPMIEEARLRKGADELAAIREAAACTLATMDSVRRLVRTGITELELSRAIGGGIVQFGENAAIPHGGPTGRALKRGDVILADTGNTVEGYWSDISRTIFFGRPTAEYRKVYEIVQNAQKAAIAAIRPGVTCQSVDRAARDVIENAGYGEYFIHRTGHGLGLDIHEPPYLVKGNRRRLKSGMVVTVEPGIYLPGRFGVRIEDDVAVTKTGRKILSKF